MGRRADRWRKLRQGVQVLGVLLFLAIFVYATYLSPRRAWADLFYRLDPLIAATSSLASRRWIAGFGLALVTLAVTLVFGRVWCGWFCPMGTVLGWLSPEKRRQSRSEPKEAWRSAKYLVLVALVVAALLGNQTLLFLDPMTIATRTMAVAVWPALKQATYGAEEALYQIPALWGPLDWLHGTVVYPVFRDIDSAFGWAIPTLLFFALIVGLNWWAERAWCRYFCPLGGLLALLSKLALVRRDVGDTCARCALCGGDCPTGTIEPSRGYRSDPAECIVCYDCIVDCSREGVAFRWLGTRWHPEEAHPYDPKRRELMAAAGVAVAGVALAGVEPISQREPPMLIRPPGATSPEFETLCVRCGECVRVCPTQGLQPSFVEAGFQNILTPRLVPRLGYCDYTCTACGDVCPTQAIPKMVLSAKQTTPIGLARVDRDRCLPWAYSVPCIVCEEACPVPHKAIGLEVVEVVDGQGQLVTIQRPIVVRELCIGCGICEYQCPMGGESAIRVDTLTEAGVYLGATVGEGHQGLHGQGQGRGHGGGGQ